MKNLTSLAFAIALLSVPAASQFREGPTLLGRAIMQPRGENSLFPIRPFGGVNFRYSRSVRPPELLGSGTRDRDYSSVNGYAGLAGEHVWKRSYLSTSYLGSYGYYPGQDSNEVYDRSGYDQSLSLAYGTMLSRRLSVVLTQNGGMYRRGYGLGLTGFPGVGGEILAFGMNDALAPVDSFVDTRTYSLASGGQMVFQKSQRLSFSAGGTGFWIQRRQLSGAQGAVARGDVSYRLGRRQQIGAYYSFSRFDLTKVYSESYIHNAGFGYARTLTPRWDLRMQAGVFRLESTRTQRVSLPPLVAALLGETSGLEIFHGTRIGGEGGLSLRGRFRFSSLGFSFRRGVMPGNGVFLTSMQDRSQVSYGYSRFKDWGLGAQLMWTRLSDQIQAGRKANLYTGSVSVGRRLAGVLHFNASYGYSRNKFGSVTQDYQTLSAGISVAAAPLPLLFW